MMPVSELIIGGAALLQGLILILFKGPGSKKAIEVISVASFLSASAYLIAIANNQTGYVIFNMLEDEPLFRLPRAAIFVVGLLLSRTISWTYELPNGRKSEVLFLLSILSLFCDLLILSQHGSLTFILLVVSTWLGLFLSGLAYRGRLEGEAVLKYWLQSSIGMAVAFGAILALALVAGGLHYSGISAYLQSQPTYTLNSLVVVAALCLPFLMAGGLFPFHLVPIDRDQGVPWSVQAILAVMLQGSIALAAWKMGIEIFGKAHPNQLSDGMRTLQFCGLIGGFWLAVFALSQQNSKRFFSALIGAQWSALLAAGALPTLLSMAAVAYAFSAVFIWGGMLAFVWSRFQEYSGGERLKDVGGLARSFRTSGLILLLALASPLCVPGLPGFPAVLHLLAAVIEQKSLAFLIAQVSLILLICLLSLRAGADLLFGDSGKPVLERESHPKVAAAYFEYGYLDWAVMALLAAALLSLGFFWHQLLQAMSISAKTFLG